MQSRLNDPEGNDLAQWLVEAGRRAKLDSNPALASPHVDAVSAGEGASAHAVKRSILMSATALAFLQYYYFHVMVEIGKLPTLIVFVPSPLS